MRGLRVSSDDMRSMALEEHWQFMFRADARVAGRPSTRISLFSSESAGGFVTHDRVSWAVNKIEVRAVLDWTMCELPEQVAAAPAVGEYLTVPRERFDEVIASAVDSRQVVRRPVEEGQENADLLDLLQGAWPTFGARGMVRVAGLDLRNDRALMPSRSTGWAVGDDGEAWIFDLPDPADVRGDVHIERVPTSGLLLQMLVSVKELGFEGWDRLVLRTGLASV